MKKFIKVLSLLAILVIASPANSFASATEPVVISKEAEIKRLNDRLEEIRALDSKSMTREQKRVLRKEVRSIKKEMAVVGGGVYLSVAAILIIALLLILLL